VRVASTLASVGDDSFFSCRFFRVPLSSSVAFTPISVKAPPLLKEQNKR